MKSKKLGGVLGIIIAVFMAVFALPFLGGYFMLEKNTQTKVIGAILLVVGVVIWFLFGVH